MPSRNTKSERREFFDHRNRMVGVLSCLTFVALSGCTKPIDVNVGTTEPVKVDLSMDVHVYQHSDAESELEKEGRKTLKEVTTRMRNRMEEIQIMKNSRQVGENAEGLLSILQLPAGEDGKWVADTVKAENEDRNFMMTHEASQKGAPLPEVRRLHWRHAQKKAFKGEQIQVENPDKPGEFFWEEKKVAEKTEGGE